MTKITKHYHGFEVTIEPVDGYELTEEDYEFIYSDIADWSNFDFFIEFYIKTEEGRACLWYAMDVDNILAKIEAKRMPEKEQKKQEEPMTVSVLSEILERLDNMEANIKNLDMDLFKLKYGKTPS